MMKRSSSLLSSIIVVALILVFTCIENQVVSFRFGGTTITNYSRRIEKKHKLVAVGVPNHHQPSSPRYSQTTHDNEIIKQEVTLTKNGYVMGPDTKPNYDEMYGPLGPTLDKVFLTIFRTKMAENVGVDSKLPKDDYQGLMELTAALNARYSNRQQVHAIAQNVLRSLFPSWLPGAFALIIAKPFPEFASRMNAWVTVIAGTWLMGECEVNDVEIDSTDGTTNIGVQQGLLVKQCRFLQESSCASVCMNSCKIPTQNFFNQDMGLPLTMTPNYDTFECQFAFGKTPCAEEETALLNTPCLQNCPTLGKLRQWHSTNDAKETKAIVKPTPIDANGICHLMNEE